MAPEASRHSVTLMRLLYRLGVVGACAVFSLGGARADFINLEPLRAYVDLGIAVSDAATSGLEAGAGKLRYGEDRDTRVDPVLSEARLIGAVGLGAAWRGVLEIKYDDRQRHLLDIGEATLTYRSPPAASGLRWRVKAGSFLPPFSLENRGIGWTSPYTLSSSALNAWIGEELRINGAELRLIFDHRGWQYTLAGASYIANDAAGTLLAFRGWALHDRELGLFDRMRLPRYQVTVFEEYGLFSWHSRFFEPFHEIDHRPGFYAGATVRDAAERRFEIYYYNNDGNPHKFNNRHGQYAWRTRFWVAGFETPLPLKLRFVSQAMVGDTIMGRLTRFGPGRPVVADYFTGYGLLSKSFRWVDLSFRGEYFEVRDKDYRRGPYDNAESGYGLTFAVTHAPTSYAKIYLELQYVDHERPARAFEGEPRRFDEWLLRANLRLFY